MENGDLYFNIVVYVVLLYTMLHYLCMIIFTTTFERTDFICDHEICYLTHN